MRYSPNSHIWDLWSKGGPFVGSLGETLDGESVAATTRVTVEPNWYLEPSMQAGNFTQVPVRSFQSKANDQYEVEIPNIRSVSTDRSISNDSATCSIVLNNQWHYENGSLLTNLADLGQPGYLTFSRGSSDAGNQRWGHTENDWANILIPNALLRTYSGYGGKEPIGNLLTSRDSGAITYPTDLYAGQNDNLVTEDYQQIHLDSLGGIEAISTAVGRGRLVQTGMWLIDEVVIGSNGDIEVRCRDMAKLLIEQQVFPPLVPDDSWPVAYCRYEYPGGSNSAHVYGQNSLLPTGLYAHYLAHYDSSSNYVSGPVYLLPIVDPNPGINAINLRGNDYWLSEGKAHRTDQVWIEFSLSGAVDYVMVTPRGANYTCFVSVSEDYGATWEGVSGAKYGLAFNVVASAGLGANGVTKNIKMPRTYSATRIRLTFTNLQKSTVPQQDQRDNGPYRVGLLEFRACDLRTQSTTRNINSIAQGVLPATDARLGKSQGYWLGGDDGAIFAIGPKTSNHGSSTITNSYYSDYPWTDVSAMYGDHGGYWTLRSDGRVLAFGNAVYYGHTASPGTIAISARSDNAGYFTLDLFGNLRAYGSASGSDTLLRDNNGVIQSGIRRLYPFGTAGKPAASVMPSGAYAVDAATTVNGCYVLDITGKVYTFGTAAFYGDNSTLGSNAKMKGAAVAIAVYYEPNSVGMSVTGYYVLTDAGYVYNFGSAPHKGDASSSGTDLCVDIIQSQQGEDGYLIASKDGNVYSFGNAKGWGDIYHAGSTWQLQTDGNYLDYVTIVKHLLLWAGWWLKDDSYSTSLFPEVLGNIEDTGIFSDSCLPEKMFDKRPVIDVINELKEIVGYFFYVDELGGAHFELPTWYTDGNFINETGAHTTFVPIVDELTNLLSYSIDYNDKAIRSKIIVATSDPMDNTAGTKTSILDGDSDLLRGMTRPMMFVNQMFLKQSELDIMAELVAMQLNFQQRLGTASIVANPLLQIGDKVRIYERVTAESYVHYIRGIQTTHDLQTGSYTQTLTTNWLGNYGEGTWAIRFQKGSLKSGPQPDGTFVLSQATIDFLQASKNRQTAYTPIETPPIVSTPPPTGFAANHNFVGWNLPLVAPSVAWDDIGDQGARIVRTDAYWASLQSANPTNAGPGQNDYLDPAALSLLDNFVSEANRKGIYVWLSASYTPRWARPNYLTAPGYVTWAGEDHIPPEREPNNLFPDYANFVWLLSERYSRLYPGTVVAIGVWNEPNLANFWMQPPGTGTQPNVNYSPDAGRYTELLRGAFRAVKNGIVANRPNRASFPNIIVTTAGTSPAGGNGNGGGYSPANFLQAIINSGGAQSFDHVDHHPYCWDYGPNLPQSYNAFLQMHDLWAILQASGRTDAKIWASEIGAITYPDAAGTDINSPFGTGGYTPQTATSATNNTLTRTGAGWTPNAYVGSLATILAGPGAGQSKLVTSNTTTTLTFASNWTTNPTAGSTFGVCPSINWITDYQAINYTLGATRVAEMFDAWRSNAWYDLGAMKHILGPMVWYLPYDSQPNINSNWVVNKESYFGFKEYGTNGYDGPAKGTMLDVWSSYAALDATAPVGHISAPTEGSTVSGSVGIAVTATDNRDDYIERVDFLVDGTVVGRFLPGFGYIYLWDSTTASNGSHTLTAIMTDNAGNSIATTAVHVIVSNGSTSGANGLTDYRSVGTLNSRGVENPRLWNTNTAAFDPPSDAFYVDALSGSDLNTGATPSAPVRTLAAAVTAVNAGTQNRTIVLNTGEYRTGHAPITNTSKVLGIQALRNASVWVKGSDLFIDWIFQNGVWEYNGSYVPNIVQGTGLNPLNDQLFVNDIPYAQVLTKAALVPGTFFVDPVAHKIHIGNGSTWVPTNNKIEVTVRGYVCGSASQGNSKTGFFYKGVGFAHWGSDNEGAAKDTHGAVRMTGTSQGLYYSTFAYASYMPLDFTYANGLTINDCLFVSNSGLGMHSFQDINTTINRVRVAWSNWERGYDITNGATGTIAGYKATNSSGARVNDVIFENNYCNGLWFDVRCQNSIVTKIYASDNYVYGLTGENGDGLKVVDGVFARNGNTAIFSRDGYRIAGYSNCEVWNVTSVDNVGSAFGLYEYSTTNSTTPSTPKSLGDTYNLRYYNNVNVGTTRCTNRPLMNSFNALINQAGGQQTKTFTTEEMFATDPYVLPLVENSGSNVWIRLVVSASQPQFKWATPTANFAGDGVTPVAGTGSTTTKTLTQVQSQYGCEVNSIGIDDDGAALVEYFPNVAQNDFVWSGGSIPKDGSANTGTIPPNWVCDILGIAHGAVAHYGAYNAPRPM